MTKKKKQKEIALPCEIEKQKKQLSSFLAL